MHRLHWSRELRLIYIFFYSSADVLSMELHSSVLTEVLGHGSESQALRRLTLCRLDSLSSIALPEGWVVGPPLRRFSHLSLS